MYTRVSRSINHSCLGIQLTWCTAPRAFYIKYYNIIINLSWKIIPWFCISLFVSHLSLDTSRKNIFREKNNNIPESSTYREIITVKLYGIVNYLTLSRYLFLSFLLLREKIHFTRLALMMTQHSYECTANLSSVLKSCRIIKLSLISELHCAMEMLPLLKWKSRYAHVSVSINYTRRDGGDGRRVSALSPASNLLLRVSFGSRISLVPGTFKHRPPLSPLLSSLSFSLHEYFETFHHARLRIPRWWRWCLVIYFIRCNQIDRPDDTALRVMRIHDSDRVSWKIKLLTVVCEQGW